VIYDYSVVGVEQHFMQIFIRSGLSVYRLHDYQRLSIFQLLLRKDSKSIFVSLSCSSCFVLYFCKRDLHMNNVLLHC
jgi:hypothetical protein